MKQSVSSATSVAGRASPVNSPWQLKMFSKTMKKKQKLALLLRQLGDIDGKKCLLVTNGDNNGAMNYQFRDHGGEWIWVENEADSIREMQEFLAEEVRKGEADRIPADDASCDVVVAIDVHEHLKDCRPFNRELMRITRPGGMVVVTTPNGSAWKPVTLLKNLIGMTREKYGHYVIGYTIAQHRQMLSEVGFVPIAAGSYSKFFTEILELMINFAFVMVLRKQKKVQAKEGTIAPTSGAQLKAVEKQYRLYSLAYPVLWAISRLDLILFCTTGYAVSVVCRRPA
jgi:SAM-dependent methyltransferase